MRVGVRRRRSATASGRGAPRAGELNHALAEVVSESHAALSKLQFQDVCAQSLLQIDGGLADVSHQLAADWGVDADIPPAAHPTVTNDDVEVNRSEAGEVLLF